MRMQANRPASVVAAIVFIVAGCSSAAPAASPTAAPTPSAAPVVTAAPTPVPTAAATASATPAPTPTAASLLPAPTASPASAAPSVTPTVAASTAPTTAPTVAPSGSDGLPNEVPDLAAFLPPTFDEIPLERQSLHGTEVLGEDAASVVITSYLSTQGKTPADLEVAEADDPTGTVGISFIAFRLPGSDPTGLLEAVVGASSASFPELIVSTATINGRQVTKGVMEGRVEYPVRAQRRGARRRAAARRRTSPTRRSPRCRKGSTAAKVRPKGRRTEAALGSAVAPPGVSAGAAALVDRDDPVAVLAAARRDDDHVVADASTHQRPPDGRRRRDLAG